MFFSILLIVVISLIGIMAIMLIACIFSTIKIDIKKVYISNVETDKLNYDYVFYIKLYLFNFIKFFQLKIDKEKLENSKMFVNLKSKKLSKPFGDANIGIHNLHVRTDSFNLKMKLGTENLIVTTFAIVLASTFISYILKNTINKVDKDKHYYKIEPLYLEKNQISMSLKCIISIKMVHIISTIYIIWKKERIKNERTSNRRVNGNSHE